MKHTKKILAALLALAMVLSLAACNRQEGENTPGQAPENTAAPEFVYSATYTDLGGVDKNASSLSALCYTDDGFYAARYEKIGERELEEGETLEYEGQLDVNAYVPYFVSYSGELTKLEQYKPLPAVEDTEGRTNFSSDEGSISGLVQNDDGTLTVLESVYCSWYDGPEKEPDTSAEGYYDHVQYDQFYYVRRLNADGSEISSAQADLEGKEPMFYSGNGLITDSSGNLLISYYGSTDSSAGGFMTMGEPGLVAIAPDGSVAYDIPSGGNGDRLIKLADGRIGTTTWGDQGMELQIIDVEKGALGDSYDIPSDAYDLISGGGDYDFYYTSGVSFYGYKLESGTADKLLNWIECDVDGSDLNNLKILEDGTILGVYNDWSGETVKCQLVTVKKVPYDSVPHKEVLTLAVQYVDYQIRREVLRFNRSNDKVRINIIDYSEYNTEDDYSAGTTKLTTELLSGTLPDLISLDEMPYSQLAAKGYLEDLYPYLDSDEELGREDFFDSVLKALEVDGKLCQISPSFSVMTVLGASSVVGDEPGWTYEELYAALETMPEGCDIFDSTTTQSDILMYCLYMNMDKLVDWTTGECHFDSEDFRKILDFASRFQKEYDWDNYESSEDSQTVRIAQGKQMLMPTSVSDFHSIQIDDLQFGAGRSSARSSGTGVIGGAGSMVSYVTVDSGGTSAAEAPAEEKPAEEEPSGEAPADEAPAKTGGPVEERSTTYIGFPTVDGSAGNAFTFQSGLAMSSKCANKEAAWSFLRGFLTEDYQKDEVWNLPVNKNVFMDELKEAATPRYRTDANGNYVLDENGEKIEESFGGVSFGDGTSYDYYALSQAQADRLLALVENTSKVIDYNDSLLEIVQQELEPYFAGQKTADEVAKLIQSKAYIYINEQR